MGSIFGQMAEAGAGGGMGAGGSPLSMLGSLGSSLGSFMGGGGFGTPPTVDNSGITASVAANPVTSPYAGGGPASTPTGYTAPGTPGDVGGTMTSDPSLALPAATAINPVGGNPAMASENILGGMGLGLGGPAIDPVSGQPLNTATGATNDPSGFWGSAVGKWLLGDVTGSKGAFGSPARALGSVGDIMEAVNRWRVQQTLQDPNAIAKNAQKLFLPMSKAYKRAIIGPVTAAAQETGQINAPGLYSQAVATALAPEQYRMQQNALNEYLAALQASEQAYPQGGLFGPGGGTVQPGLFGGGANA